MKWMLASILASASPQQSCEIHVWPAFATSAWTAGWLSNLGPAGALQDYERNKDDRLRSQADLIEALPPPRQAEIIHSVGLSRLPGFADLHVVYEGHPPAGGVAKAALSRQSNSVVPCYAELIVRRNVYRRSPLHGSRLGTDFLFRDFRSSRVRSVKATVTSRLREGSDGKEAELAEAFRANVSDFLRRLGRAR